MVARPTATLQVANMKEQQKSKQTIIFGLMFILFNIDPSITRRYYYFFQAMRKQCGIKYAIAYFKQARLHITKYICKEPLFQNSCGVSLTKEGFPKRLIYLKELIDSKDLVQIRGVLTLLSYTKSIIPTKDESLKIKPSFSTITDKYKGKEYTIPH